MFCIRKIIKIAVVLFVFSNGLILAGFGERKAAIFKAFVARDQAAFQKAMEEAAADPSFTKEELVRWIEKALEKKGLTYTPGDGGDEGGDEESAEIRAIRAAIIAVGVDAFNDAVRALTEAVRRDDREALIELFREALAVEEGEGWKEIVTACARDIFTAEELRGRLGIAPVTLAPTPTSAPRDLLELFREDRGGVDDSRIVDAATDKALALMGRGDGRISTSNADGSSWLPAIAAGATASVLLALFAMLGRKVVK